MVDFKKLLREHQLQETITALCDYSGRCPTCYRFFTAEDKMNCSGYKEYYTDCSCEPLPPKEIVDWEDD